jgi:hypothetical protein
MQLIEIILLDFGGLRRGRTQTTSTLLSRRLPHVFQIVQVARKVRFYGKTRFSREQQVSTARQFSNHSKLLTMRSQLKFKVCTIGSQPVGEKTTNICMSILQYQRATAKEVFFSRTNQMDEFHCLEQQGSWRSVVWRRMMIP